MLDRRCPVCGKENVRKTRTKGFIEADLLSIIRLCPYRCRDCRNRFYRFSLRNGLHSTRRVKQRKRKTGGHESFSQFLSPMDEKEFRELIVEIGEAERKLFGDLKSEANDG